MKPQKNNSKALKRTCLTSGTAPVPLKVILVYFYMKPISCHCSVLLSKLRIDFKTSDGEELQKDGWHFCTRPINWSTSLQKVGRIPSSAPSPLETNERGRVNVSCRVHFLPPSGHPARIKGSVCASSEQTLRPLVAGNQKDNRKMR